MSEKSPAPRPESRITVDGGEFYSFVRALKRSYRASDVGEVVMSVRDRTLVIETARGNCVLPCNDAPPVVARVHGGNFCRLASLVTDAKATGPLVIVFHPNLGEVALPHAGTKARFDHLDKTGMKTQIQKTRPTRRGQTAARARQQGGMFSR